MRSTLYLPDQSSAAGGVFRARPADRWRCGYPLAEGFTVDSLPTAAEYAQMFAEAGLEVVHQEDATEHLRRSAARIDQLVADNYAKVVEKGGAAFAEEFKTMIGKVSRLERDHLGYTIVTARKRAS